MCCEDSQIVLIIYLWNILTNPKLSWDLSPSCLWQWGGNSDTEERRDTTHHTLHLKQTNYLQSIKSKIILHSQCWYFLVLADIMLISADAAQTAQSADNLGLDILKLYRQIRPPSPLGRNSVVTVAYNWFYKQDFSFPILESIKF